MHASQCGDFRLQRVHGFPIQPLKRSRAIGQGRCAIASECLELALAGGDDDLAAAAMGDLMSGAVVVEQRLASHAQPRLQRPPGVVDAGVDHLRVARTALPADHLGTLGHHHFQAFPRQFAGHRKPHRAGTDD